MRFCWFAWLDGGDTVIEVQHCRYWITTLIKIRYRMNKEIFITWTQLVPAAPAAASRLVRLLLTEFPY